MRKPINFQRSEERARLSTMDRHEAEAFSASISRDIIHTDSGQALCDLLIETLNEIAAGDALREKAAELVRIIASRSENAKIAA